MLDQELQNQCPSVNGKNYFRNWEITTEMKIDNEKEVFNLEQQD